MSPVSPAGRHGPALGSAEARARTGQLEAFVLSGYQRLEALDVPVFASPPQPKPALAPLAARCATLLLLPTDFPDEVASTAQWLSGTQQVALTPIERLSLLLRYLAAPMRIEPDAESVVHKAVPSARMLCPVRYFILINDHGTIVSYRYDGNHHALEMVARMPDTGDVFPGTMAIASAARPDWIKPLYGDFSVFPCVLEAGHGLAQIGLLADLLEFDATGATRRTALRALLPHDRDLPLYLVPINTAEPVVLTGLPEVAVRVAERSDTPGPAGNLAGAHDFAALFDGGAGCVQFENGQRSNNSGATCAQIDGVFSALRARSSGNDRSGLAASLDQLPGTLFEDLLGRFNAIRRSRFRLPGEAAVDIRFACLRPDIATPALYDCEGQTVRSSPQGAEFVARLERMLPYRGMRYNLSTLVLSVLITVDPVEAINLLGDAALRETHLAAGALAQDFGNAAAAFGLFARPMRMMRESTLEPVINLDGQLIYQVLCGAARRANRAMELA